jgi:hypothetical protein
MISVSKPNKAREHKKATSGAGTSHQPQKSQKSIGSQTRQKTFPRQRLPRKKIKDEFDHLTTYSPFK